MLLLGLSGRKRVGKSTISRIIQQRYQFVGAAFADPVYEIASVLLGFDARSVPSEAKEDKFPSLQMKSLRQVLQWIGTEFGRDMVGPDLWTFHMNKRLRRPPYSSAIGVVIDDVRFENEVKLIHAHNGKVVRLTGPDDVHGDTHRSELHTFPVDLTIGRGEDAEATAAAIMAWLTTPPDLQADKSSLHVPLAVAAEAAVLGDADDA